MMMMALAPDRRLIPEETLDRLAAAETAIRAARELCSSAETRIAELRALLAEDDDEPSP